MESTVKLSEINEFICCPICQGYLIDATTVNECLHTFCKSCIVKHIKNDHNECPKCNTIIHERRPLDYIIHDRNKQDIVYKLVPQLYISELNNRLLIEKTQYLHVILVAKTKSPMPIYLKCPIIVKVGHIRKLLAVKYQLTVNDRISLFYKGDIVSDADHVSNLAQSLTFCLHYEILRSLPEYEINS